MIRIEAHDVAGLTSTQTAAMLQRRLGRSDEDAARRRMPLPAPLQQLLPGGVARGSTIAHQGSAALVLGMAAAVTAAGQHVALVDVSGRSDVELSLLAFQELGGVLERLAVVGPVPADAAQSVVATLLDGMDLVVAGVGTGAPAPRALRILQARARKCESSLMFSGTTAIEGADLTMAARCVAIEGMGRGRGRVRTRVHEVRLHPRGGRAVRGLIRSEPGPGGRIDWTLQTAQAAARPFELLTGTDS